MVNRATVGRVKSRPYILWASFVLLVLLLAGCGGDQATSTPTINVQLGDLPSYPNLAGTVTTMDSASFPQIAQWSSVQGITFISPDDSVTIRQWYKQQLTAKGWLVVADAPNLLGLVPNNREQLIELFLSPSGSGVAGTKVLAYYATGRKPTPAP